MSADKEVVFLSAVRTPFGTFGGSLRDVTATDFTTVAAKEAFRRAGIDAADIDSTTIGNVLYPTADSAYFSRHVSLKAGCREESSALTLHRLRGSRVQFVMARAREI